MGPPSSPRFYDMSNNYLTTRANEEVWAHFLLSFGKHAKVFSFILKRVHRIRRRFDPRFRAFYEAFFFLYFGMIPTSQKIK